MKPPSSDAEALRDQKATQVRATYGFFMAADEFSYLERRQETVREPSVRGRLFSHRVNGVRSMRRFWVRDLRHRSSSARLRRRSGVRRLTLVVDVSSRLVP